MFVWARVGQEMKFGNETTGGHLLSRRSEMVEKTASFDSDTSSAVAKTMLRIACIGQWTKFWNTPVFKGLQELQEMY